MLNAQRRTCRSLRLPSTDPGNPSECAATSYVEGGRAGWLIEQAKRLRSLARAHAHSLYIRLSSFEIRHILLFLPRRPEQIPDKPGQIWGRLNRLMPPGFWKGSATDGGAS